MALGAILQACVELLHNTICLTLPLPYHSKYFFTGIVDRVSCICFQDLKHRLLQSQVRRKTLCLHVFKCQRANSDECPARTCPIPLLDAAPPTEEFCDIKVLIGSSTICATLNVQ